MRKSNTRDIQVTKRRIDILFKVCLGLAIVMSLLIIMGVVSATVVYNPNVISMVTFAFFLYYRIYAVILIIHIIMLVILLKNKIKEKNFFLKLLGSFALVTLPLIVYTLITFTVLMQAYGIH